MSLGEPVFALHCHCRDCQRQSGAAHVPAARVPSAGFRILLGTLKRYVTKTDSGNDIVRAFCGDCGTPLYVQVGSGPDLVGLRVCTLDDPGLVQTRCRHFHEKRTAPGPRPARRTEARPGGTFLSSRAVPRRTVTD